MEFIKIKDILLVKNSFTKIIFVSPHDKLSEAIHIMQEFEISQLPVVDSNQTVVGSINEANLMQLSHDGIDFSQQTISAVMGKPLPVLDENTDVSEAYRLLLSGATAVLVENSVGLTGLITRIDLINYWIKRKKEISYAI